MQKNGAQQTSRRLQQGRCEPLQGTFHLRQEGCGRPNILTKTVETATA